MYPEYPDIDMKQTGLRLQSVIKNAGYSVREIQEYLHLSCPQPIYRWYKGQILPSLNHVYALSRLLHVHMEDLLVTRTNEKPETAIWAVDPVKKPADMQRLQEKRLQMYRQRLFEAA